jgi:hypothetical protein
MSLTIQERQLTENPRGKGSVFKGKGFISEVFYELQVLKGLNDTLVPIIVGRIKWAEKSGRLWATEIYTLHLEDNRKLDFICVDFNPDCEIVTDKGFYS